MTVDESLIRTLRSLSTPTISDAADRLAIVVQASAILRITGTGTVAGPAFTVQYVPVGTEGGTVGDYLDEVDTGAFVVLSNHGRLDATVWGGLLSELAARREIAGTAVDGICRDTPRAAALDYPLFARARWMRTGKDRVRAQATQVPVVLGDLLVRPGDIVVGDDDGVVVLPKERVPEITEAAIAIEDAERAIREDTISGGMRLDEARAKHGYHSLQTKR
ncbi:RraA family protein [Streptomyces sp. NPDC006872]|uniref:RraA family protein n=1 Tax=Streptomyces sp. NPDC006872 TaxID=3155720 RepID=UPI0033C17022